MAYRLPGGRSELTVGDLTIEVQDIGAWPVYVAAARLAAAFGASESGSAAEFDALSALYAYFCIEAQPTWEIVDHRGVVAPTPSGMLRLPTELAMGMVNGWTEAFVAEPVETAVDKLVPPGPMRDELNARLHAVA